MTNTKSHTSHRRNGIIPKELSHSLDALHDSFGQLKADVVNLVQDAAGVGREGAGAIKDRAASAFDEVGNKIHELRNRGVHAVEHAVDDVEGKISDNPLLATGIAFGAGFIVAKLIARR